jgi:hypothetical protein
MRRKSGSMMFPSVESVFFCRTMSDATVGLELRFQEECYRRLARTTCLRMFHSLVAAC